MKKNKAFTLIELVAVLVIMAILALIVIPLVMSIIKKAKISADKRSIDAYGRSIELAIAGFLMDTGDFPTSIDQLTIEYSGDEVVCTINKINFDGSVYLTGCTVDGKSISKDYSYGEEKEEPKKSGDKIFLYKRNNSDSGEDKNTGTIYNVNKYFVSVQTSTDSSLTLVNTYECENKECRGYDYSELNNKEIIYDGNYYLYDINSKEKNKT